MRRTIDLTKVNGCYSKELRDFAPTIVFMAQEPGVSIEEMRTTVLGIVNRAGINADAKKRFISNLMECTSKESIDKLCYGAVIHGMYYHPKHKTVRV